MEISKKAIAYIALTIFLTGCSQSERDSEPEFKNSYHCYEYTIEDLITGNEYTRCLTAPQKGTIKFFMPTNWTLDTTRQIEARLFQNSDQGEPIPIGEVMNVAMNADPSEFSTISKPQDVSENIPVQGYASWSWCLKPKRSGTSYLCFEVDINGKEFGHKVMSKSIAITIQRLPLGWTRIFFLK